MLHHTLKKYNKTTQPLAVPGCVSDRHTLTPKGSLQHGHANTHVDALSDTHVQAQTNTNMHVHTQSEAPSKRLNASGNLWSMPSPVLTAILRISRPKLTFIFRFIRLKEKQQSFPFLSSPQSPAQKPQKQGINSRPDMKSCSRFLPFRLNGA